MDGAGFICPQCFYRDTFFFKGIQRIEMQSNPLPSVGLDSGSMDDRYCVVSLNSVATVNSYNGPQPSNIHTDISDHSCSIIHFLTVLLYTFQTLFYQNIFRVLDYKVAPNKLATGCM